MEDRVVVAQDPVVRVGIATELTAVEDPRVDQRSAVVGVAHVDGLPDRHVLELHPRPACLVEVDRRRSSGVEGVGHRVEPSAARNPIFSSLSARRK